jgi:16S rRNA (uracil1498-N3)-methyltransferase
VHKVFFSFDENGKGDSALITGDCAYHLLRVLRLKPGAVVTLCDGKNTDYSATLRQIDVKNLICRFDINESFPCDTEPKIPVTLYQSLPKGDKMEWVIQKSVELGVSKIVPLYTDHSLIRDVEKKTARYQLIAQSAAAQSKRGIIPEVTLPQTFSQVLKGKAESMTNGLTRTENNGRPNAFSATDKADSELFRHNENILSLVALSPGELANCQNSALGLDCQVSALGLDCQVSSLGLDCQASVLGLVRVFDKVYPTAIDLWIGPEGGFSSEEISSLLSTGVKPISLGKRVLRTETAALVALAQINLLTENLLNDISG